MIELFGLIVILTLFILFVTPGIVRHPSKWVRSGFWVLMALFQLTSTIDLFSAFIIFFSGVFAAQEWADGDC